MVSDDAFRKLLAYLDRPWAGFRKVRGGVKKRISRHMQELGCPSVEAYIQTMAGRPEIRKDCERHLLVSISRFFRDRQLWRALGQHLLPDLVNGFEAPIRIWSAGCACGQEPYSLAMVWNALPDRPDLELLATDDDERCLEWARSGVYGFSSLKEVPDDMRACFFNPYRGGRRYRINTHLLPPIIWRRHHLLDKPPPGPFHAIFLRNNLLTYHQGPTLRAALERILAVLTPGGYLVVGSHEKPPATAFALTRDAKCPWVYHYEKSF